jgi:hypothetical protein
VSLDLSVAVLTLWLSGLKLVNCFQYQLAWMGQETREYAEQIGAVTELLAGRRSKLVIRCGIEKEIGIPEVDIDEGLKEEAKGSDSNGIKLVPSVD